MPKLIRKQKTILSLDSETSGVDFWHGARPFLVTFCNEAGENIFFEWDVDPLTRKVLYDKQDLKEIQRLIQSADNLVLQNAKFDFHALEQLFQDANMSLTWDWGKVHDTLMAGHLLASNQPHDLTSMVLVYLGINIQPYEDAIDKATNEARRLARSKFPEWRIAHKDNVEMPSAKEKTWKFDMWLPRALAKETKLPKDHEWWTICAEYANPDSASTLPLFLQMEKQLKKRDLWEIYLERMKTIPITVGMENRGITCSGARLNELYSTYIEESKKAEVACKRIAATYDYKLDLPKSGNNKSLSTFIFGETRPCDFCNVTGIVDEQPCATCDGQGCYNVEYLGVKPSKTSKKTGAPSLDKTVLEDLESTLRPMSKQGIFIRNLKAKRKRDTACSYMESYKKFWLPFIDGKTIWRDWYVLHPSLNATGTDTLRWSSANPNEQNISKQDGFNLRYAFGPAPGREWWAIDYENIELRIPGYESGEEKMIELFEKPDEPPYFGSYHLLNASIVYPELFWPLAEKKGAFKEKYGATYYKWTKNGGFAKQYGAQSQKVDATFRRVGAYEKIAKNLPKMELLNRKMIEQANKQGYVETIPDKTVNPRRGYPILATRSAYGSISPTLPLNYHVQSTAMWCTMKAMICCEQYLKMLPNHFIVLQVHDEIVFDLPAGGKKNLPIVNELKRLMELSGDDIGIPLRAAVAYHPGNWSHEEELNK